ncbi:hypothetical protein ACPRNU_00945 [Chromobacterium vaccinii]|uniref:hypothetical protein n=1 Tax=Chromobacterium TaxID=535 RepID=UPI00130524EC|nr:hypothetical protein [Chromobacterium sp. ATCC 53434]
MSDKIAMEANSSLLKQALGENIDLDGNIGSALIGNEIYSFLIRDNGLVLVSALDEIQINNTMMEHALHMNTTLAFEGRGSICYDAEFEMLYYISHVHTSGNDMSSDNLRSRLELYAETRRWINDRLLLADVNVEKKTDLLSSAGGRNFSGMRNFSSLSR